MKRICEIFKIKKNSLLVALKISNLLICFYSFDLSCPILGIIFFNNKIVYCIVLLNRVFSSYLTLSSSQFTVVDGVFPVHTSFDFVS